jgi:hypothetical protein
MSLFEEIEQLIPSMEFQKTYTVPHEAIVCNVPETLRTGISKEIFSKNVKGYNHYKLPLTISIISISKTEKDNYQNINTIVRWLIKKPNSYNINNYSTPLDIVTDLNTQEDICLDTDNCFLKNPEEYLEEFSGDDVPKTSVYTRSKYHKKIKKCRSKKSNF